MDTIITEYDDRYVAKFCIDNDRNIRGMKELIECDDSIMFDCDGKNAIVSVIYYTHATF